MSQQQSSAYARRRRRAESSCMSMFRNLDSKLYSGVHTLSNNIISTPNNLINMLQTFAQSRECSRTNVTVT